MTSSHQRYLDSYEKLIGDGHKKLKSQAERVIKKFGSPQRLHEALTILGYKKDLSSIYRWLYPKGPRRGTGGVIPPKFWDAIIKAGIIEGVILNADDFDPRPRY